MSTATASAGAAVRTYGGWRRARGLGLGRLTPSQTALLVGTALVTSLTTVIVGVRPGLVLGVVGVMALGVSLCQRDGISLLDYATAGARYRWAAARGETSYRGGVLARWPQASTLPGVLASTELLDVEVPGRGRCGLVYDPRTGLMSGTLLLSTGGTLLADSDTAAGYVSAWGSILAGLADTPAVRWATVTVEITPDAGPALRHDVDARRDAGAPALARQVLDELVAAAPAAASRVATRLTVTVNPDAGLFGADRARSVADGAAATVRILDSINTSAAGAEVLRRASAADLIRIVRCAFDPQARHHSAQTWAGAAADPADGGLCWGDAGPVGAEEDPQVYRHEEAYSVSWALLEAPRQQVAHNVLLRLLTPGTFARRVTLAYRVLERDEAGAELEREQTAADARAAYRARVRRDENARERKDRTLAAAAAAEEAAGAGLAHLALYVTTTVTDPADLPAARAEVENAAGAARLRLRRMRFAQGAGFAAGLPAGVYPPHLRRARRSTATGTGARRHKIGRGD